MKAHRKNIRKYRRRTQKSYFNCVNCRKQEEKPSYFRYYKATGYCEECGKKIYNGELTVI